MRVLPGKAVLQKDEVDVKRNDALRSLSGFPQKNLSNFPSKEISESCFSSTMQNNEVNQDKAKPESSLKNSKDDCIVLLENDHDARIKKYEKERLKEDKLKLLFKASVDLSHVFLAISIISFIRLLQIFVLEYYQPSTTMGIIFKNCWLAYTIVVYFFSFQYLIVTSISMWQNMAYFKIANARLKELSV